MNNREEIQKAIREKFLKFSSSEYQGFKYPIGTAGLKALGYGSDVLEKLPESVGKFFCGVGNPIGLHEIRSGEKVLDVGCGAGIDLILAAKLVGSGGKASGVDLSPEMVELARENIQKTGAGNAEVFTGVSENLPCPDEVYDVVISNGVINLSVDKLKTYHEIFRVLKPGGRFQYADIILEEGLPASVIENVSAWSD